MKDFNATEGSYRFLHKDYIGSILAISDEAGNRLEQRHFDAWGNFTHLKIGNDPTITNKVLINERMLVLDRGYTGHEHFDEVGIIHMNGRLYDPLLRRFLNADENIQDPTNTQNYNKYGYVMNNPMMYNDPSGEFWGWLIGAVVGSYFSGVQANNGNFNPVKWDWKNTWTSVVGGGIAGAALGQGIQNISVSGAKLLQNSVVGAAGGIFNGLSSGQNIFKSALTGFAGVNTSIDVFSNKMNSTDISSVYSSRKNSNYNEDNALLDILHYDSIFRTDGCTILQEQLGKNYSLEAAPDFSEDGMKKMVSTTPELKRIYELGNSEAKFHAVTYIPAYRIDVPSLTAGITYGTLVYVSKTAITNNFILGLVLGHEMIHVYHNLSFRKQWMSELKDTSGRKTNFVSEVEAHTWSKLMGDPSAPSNISYYQNLLHDFKVNYKPKNTF